MSESSIIKKSVLAGVLIAIGALFSIAAKTYGNVVQGLCFSGGKRYDEPTQVCEHYVAKGKQ